MAGEGSVRSRIVTSELLQKISQAKAHCRKFAVANNRDAVREISVTLALYVLGIAIFPLLTNSLLWYAGAIFCGFVNARIISLFHDCNHGAHFQVKAANLWVGRFFSALVGINYGAWYREHELEHHNKLGRSDNIFASDPSSTIIMTSKSWDEAPPWKRALWRLLRNPFIFFSIWPTLLILCGVQNPGKVPGLNYIVGVPPYSIVKSDLIDQILPVAIPALQVWLVQSLVGAGYWRYYALGKAIGYSVFFMTVHLTHAPAGVHVYYDYPKGEYNADVASYVDSALYAVPWWLNWVTTNSQYHHIHHLNRKVPCYNLRACHDSAPPGTWDDLPILSYKATFQSLFTTIYDDDNCCFRSFPEYNWILPDIKPLPECSQKESAGLNKADVMGKEE